MAKNAPKNDVVKQEPAVLEAPPAKPEGAETAEGGKGKKEKKAKVKRQKYPVPEEGLTEWPADFDPKRHQPLPRAAFKNEDVWLDRKASFLESAAKKLREEAEQVRQLGPNAGGGKSKKLLKVQNELDELKAAMAASGIDIAGLIAKAKGEQN